MFLTISTNAAPTPNKKKQPFPRSMKMFNIEEQCCSHNFSDTEIILENCMADLVMKGKEKMAADYKETVPMRFCQSVCENYV